MKTIQGHFLLSLIASLLLLPGAPIVGSCVQFASASNNIDSTTSPADDNLVLAEYKPIQKKHGLGRIIDWGLAKIESYDGILVSDLISAFIAAADHIFSIMIHSFKEMTLSYEELHKKEVERVGQFDAEFKHLVRLRNKIDRQCLYTKNVEDRSLCVENGMKIQENIQKLRSQRSKSEESIKRYEEMMGWCKSYNNWFC